VFRRFGESATTVHPGKEISAHANATRHGQNIVVKPHQSRRKPASRLICCIVASITIVLGGCSPFRAAEAVRVLGELSSVSEKSRPERQTPHSLGAS
jgi:hypothetical protein